MDNLFEKVMEELKKAQERINQQLEPFFGKDKFPTMDFEKSFKNVFQKMDDVHRKQIESMNAFQKEFEQKFKDMLSLQQDMMSTMMPKKPAADKKAAASAKPAATAKTATTKAEPAKKTAAPKATTAKTTRAKTTAAKTTAAKATAPKNSSEESRASETNR